MTIAPKILNNIVRSVHNHYMRDTPPPTGVFVYHNSVKTVDDEPGFFQACVKILIQYVRLREHKVNVKFKVDNLGNMIPSSLGYSY